MLSRVLKTVEKFHLVPSGSKVVVALSGGPDSVSLLHVLLRAREFLKVEVCAVHLNHMLRGEESERDEAFVKELCKNWDVELKVGRVDVAKLSAGRNVESVARDVRYRFLKEKMEEFGANLVATGHTASDLVETVLLNFITVTGFMGVRCFLPKRCFFIRPLFEVTRAEVENYLRERNIPYIVDTSNLSLNYHRNLLRHKVLPVLRQVNPSVEGAFLRTAEVVRDAEDFISSVVEPILDSYLECGEFCISAKEFSHLHRAVATELLRRAFESLTGKTLSHTKVSLILSIARETGYKEVSLGEGFFAFKEQGRLCIGRKQPVASFSYFLTTVPAVVSTPFGRLTFLKNEGEPVVRWREFKEHGLLLRNRLPGDRLHFKGFSKPLKKFLIEKKVPKRSRDRLPVAVSGGRIVWVPGIYRAYINPGEEFVGVKVEGGSEGSYNKGADRAQGA